VGFAPYRPYPFSRRLAPWPFLWLGCWGVRFTPTLDTGARLHDQSEFDNGTDVLGVFLSAVSQEPAINHTGLATGGNCCSRYVAFGRPGPHSSYRNVWSAAELQAKNEHWQLVCANVFGLQWSRRLRAMMDIRSPSSV
jgi:hypothetical protein